MDSKDGVFNSYLSGCDLVFMGALALFIYFIGKMVLTLDEFEKSG